jgi:plastocyanin
MPGWSLLLGAAVLAGIQFTPAQGESLEITIDNLEFSPSLMVARVGATITWVNKDDLAHTATVPGGWDVTIPAKKTASLALKRAGTFDYYCRFHPNMKGRIRVGMPGSAIRK